MSMLDGHRAIIQLNEGTIIDGYLRYVPSKLRKELRGATEGICESLMVEGGSDCIDVRGDFAVDECRIELHDGRAVTCIRFNVYKGGGGLSCDWDNASGKDVETK